MDTARYPADCRQQTATRSRPRAATATTRSPPCEGRRGAVPVLMKYASERVDRDERCNPPACHEDLRAPSARGS
jgi:hypothetical protein